jgi:hypothetical protein
MLGKLCYKTTPGPTRFWLKRSKINRYWVKTGLLAAAKRNIWKYQLPRHYVNAGPSGRAVYLIRGSKAPRVLRSWVRIPRRHGCLYVVRVVCCQVEVSATGWSLVQRSPTDCGTSCVMKQPRERGGHSPRWAVEAERERERERERNNNWHYVNVERTKCMYFKRLGRWRLGLRSRYPVFGIRVLHNVLMSNTPLITVPNPGVRKGWLCNIISFG